MGLQLCHQWLQDHFKVLKLSGCLEGATTAVQMLDPVRNLTELSILLLFFLLNFFLSVLWIFLLTVFNEQEQISGDLDLLIYEAHSSKK